jgi:hypothetical protein
VKTALYLTVHGTDNEALRSEDLISSSSFPTHWSTRSSMAWTVSLSDSSRSPRSGVSPSHNWSSCDERERYSSWLLGVCVCVCVCVCVFVPCFCTSHSPHSPAHWLPLCPPWLSWGAGAERSVWLLAGLTAAGNDYSVSPVLSTHKQQTEQNVLLVKYWSMGFFIYQKCVTS